MTAVRRFIIVLFYPTIYLPKLSMIVCSAVLSRMLGLLTSFHKERTVGT